MFLFWGRVWGVFGCGDAVDDLATRVCRGAHKRDDSDEDEAQVHQDRRAGAAAINEGEAGGEPEAAAHLLRLLEDDGGEVGKGRGTQRVAAEVARIEAVKETAAAKKATLIGTFSMLRGSWAVRAKGQLEEVGGVLEAVKKLQRARRSQASSGGVELCAASSARCIAPRAVVSSAY